VQLLTVRETAAVLGVKEKTLYQWAETGQIPCVKLNGSLRFDQEEIQAWVSSCKRSVENSYNPITKLEARKGGRDKE
jgi:excisionase family DNA binding protein